MRAGPVTARVEAAREWSKSRARQYLEVVVYALLLALFVRTFLFQTCRVPSRSMEDSILPGDHILVDKFALAPHPAWLERILPYRAVLHRDVVVFEPPFPGGGTSQYVKRVIGLPGDRIAGGETLVFRNGSLLDEPYKTLREPSGDMEPEGAKAPAVVLLPGREVPAGEYYVMGDNRQMSQDSRVWGTVPGPLIRGRAMLVYWSFAVPPEVAELVDGQGDLGPWAKRGLALGFTLRHAVRGTRWSRTFHVIR